MTDNTGMGCNLITFINMDTYVHLQIDGKNVVNVNGQIRQFKTKQQADSYLKIRGLLK